MSDLLDIPNEIETRCLIGQGVSDEALLETPCLRASRVRFLDDGTFHFADDGQRALVFRVLECGCEIDRIAWLHRDSRLATWRGVAFALGQDQIFNPATYFAGGALRVHRTPLDWLKADRDGICIAQQRFAYSQLAHVERLLFSDKVYGAQVKRWLQPPEPRAEFLVEIEQVAA
jgi:hypothetical protein